jgi:hypothetical protein
MQQAKTSNGIYGNGQIARQSSTAEKRAENGQAFGMPSGKTSGMSGVNQQPKIKIATVNVRNKF